MLLQWQFHRMTMAILLQHDGNVTLAPLLCHHTAIAMQSFRYDYAIIPPPYME